MARALWAAGVALLISAAAPAEAALLAIDLTASPPRPETAAAPPPAPPSPPLSVPAIAGWIPLVGALALVAYRMRRADGRTRFPSAV